mmetsp:Transcript_26016/g.75336  ORF Transcript_26016/g.75336 Transcript_26016/m.75336 type:complete len:217 (+) Transcript_26016:1025-1675(+)
MRCVAARASAAAAAREQGPTRRARGRRRRGKPRRQRRRRRAPARAAGGAGPAAAQGGDALGVLGHVARGRELLARCGVLDPRHVVPQGDGVRCWARQGRLRVHAVELVRGEVPRVRLFVPLGPAGGVGALRPSHAARSCVSCPRRESPPASLPTRPYRPAPVPTRPSQHRGHSQRRRERQPPWRREARTLVNSEPSLGLVRVAARQRGLLARPGAR